MRIKHLEITGIIWCNCIQIFYFEHVADFVLCFKGMQGSSIHGVNSVIGLTRMDNSFVVLPKQKPQRQPQGIPPCPHAGAGAVQLDISLPGRQCRNHLWVTIS